MMAYKDGENFTTYCDKPYNRHSYKMVLKNGKAIHFDDYDALKAHWYHYREHTSHVDVI